MHKTSQKEDGVLLDDGMDRCDGGIDDGDAITGLGATWTQNDRGLLRKMLFLYSAEFNARKT